jgi:hypothetical protein
MPDAPQIQDTVALDGDGHVIAEARHRAGDCKRITARIALPDDPGGDITGRRPQ